ncbi:ADP-ribosyl cyclase/cyclic ADP-ribose hydrolase 2-like [Lingula anatina]|uniref:ADP-ribosyl cyclase/cyclic ADP-ribose hydrolase 2-like n=1 Tax=Lingula anatina TaxID=7574 RepID=A0A1S3KAC9_LINAN|nr:ADP-ribosyl cyclase/cyclic ADP-ribose hydrolase 2-like [Lingula anatina]|eukprot:XP_013419588.1 ADP-ribosyl cyclase/cyclic ADP-ribose hydrolase 2-like [Lingula anatina]
MSSSVGGSILRCTCLAFVFLSLCLVPRALAASAGTNRHIKEIFIGQCWYYTEYISQSLGENVQQNCTDLWEKFSRAWMYKDPCNVTMADYEPFVKAATVPGEVPTNKAVFWEAAYTLTHDYSGSRRRYVASADILTGYLGNHVFAWCGQEAEPGINFDSCPLEEDCPMFQGQYGGMYWTAVSKAFAEVSTGVIQMILNGTTAGTNVAFNETSYFNLFELPNFPKAKVTRFQLMVFHDVGKTHKETCNNGSIPLLKKRLEELGFEYDCTDDPSALRHILCLDDIESTECQFASKVLRPTSASNTIGTGFKTLVFGGILVLFYLIAIY